MGDVGDQFGFHPLTFDFLIHRSLKVHLNAPQLGLIAFKDAEVFGKCGIQISLCDGAGCPEQLSVLLLNAYDISFQYEIYDNRIYDQPQNSREPEAADQYQDEEIHAENLQNDPVRIGTDIVADQFRIKLPVGPFYPAVNLVPVFTDEASFLQTASADA